MPNPIVTVFGATGFVGRHVVRALADAGLTVRAASRHAQKAYFLKPLGEVGQIVPVSADMNDPASVEAALRGADAAVYLPGLLHASRAGFTRVHRDYPAQIAEACARLHVRRFVHISALACERGTSLYARTKHEGEGVVRSAFARVVILRPSIIFAPEDGFFARFARLATLLPALPLIGGGHTRFQPVYAGDVAAAVLSAIRLPASGHQNPEGRVYELGGPSIYTFRTLLQMIFTRIHVRPFLLPLPFGLAKTLGAVMQHLPAAPLTADQVESLKTDNIVTRGSHGLADLGIDATPLDAVLPSILARFVCGQARF